MDKLEKALQKARAQREIELNHLAAEHARTQAQYNIDPETGRPAAGNSLQIEESYLQHYHVIAHRSRNKEADIFRILRTKVLHAMNQSGFKTLGITSPNYGDGKTTVALNLAVSIALDLKQTVLLVDLDLRKPNITGYLGIDAPLGITNHFINNVPIAQCIIRPSFERLTILPAGHALDYSSEVLGSPKVVALAHELKMRYADRLIIYDMPPVLEQDDAIAFLPNVDATLLVVNEGVTTIDELKHCINALSGANVIGTVLNNSETPEKLEGVKKIWKQIMDMNPYASKENNDVIQSPS